MGVTTEWQFTGAPTPFQASQADSRVSATTGDETMRTIIRKGSAPLLSPLPL